MNTFIRLLLEAPITDSDVNKMITSGKQVSVYYQGDADNPRGWYRIEPVEIDTKKYKRPYLLAFDVTKKKSNLAELEYFDQSKIVNWNVLSTTPAELAIDYINKKKKGGGGVLPKPKKPPAPPPPVPASIEKKLEKAIKDKNVISISYTDPKQEKTQRETIKPVALGKMWSSVKADGTRNVLTKKDGTKVVKKVKVLCVRAWQQGPETKTKTPAWKFFRVDRIKTVDFKGLETFGKNDKGEPEAPGPNYNSSGDKTMNGGDVLTAKFAEGSLTESILEAIKIF